VDNIKREPLIQNESHDNLFKLLQRAQAKYGGITEIVMVEIANALNISIGEIYGVATFYSFISNHILGRNVIRICRSVPCYLKNSRMIIKSMAKELGIKPGETTSDGRFSFELVNCIGACDKAPAMLVNNDIYGNITPGKITEILHSYK